MDGARRLGRNAMILSIVSILGGIAAIAATIALNWGRKFTPLLTCQVGGVQGLGHAWDRRLLVNPVSVSRPLSVLFSLQFY